MDVRNLIDAELPPDRVPFALDADGAVARGRAARRRRRVAAWGAAGLPVVAAAVLAVALGTAALLPQPAGPDAAMQPSTPGSPAPPWQGWRELPDFPLTPGWVPPGLSEPYYQYVDLGVETTETRQGHVIMLVHYSSDGPAWQVYAEPNDTDPELDKLKATYADPDLAVTDSVVTVQGREARLVAITGTSDEDEDEAPQSVEIAAVSWQHRADRWVTVLADAAANALRYAEELVEEPFPARTPFTFDSVPEGAEVVEAAPSAMRLGLPDNDQSGEMAGEGLPSFPRELAVSLTQGPPDPGPGTDCRPDAPDGSEGPCPAPNREPVQIGDHDGELVGERTVLVYLPDGLVLEVTDQAGVLGREDLIAFAAGVDLTEFARPAER